MIKIHPVSYRSLLLASAAGLATFAAMGNGGAQATDYSITTPASSTATLYTLATGDTFTVTGAGGLTVNAMSGAIGVVDAPNAGIGAIVNAGTILSNQTTNGFGFSIDPSASVASITNNNGGLIQASGDSGVGIFNNYG